MRLPFRRISSLFVSILLIAGWLGYRRLIGYVNSPLPLTQPQLITVVPGSSRQKVLQLLQAQPWVKRPIALCWLWRFHPQLTHCKAGTYRVLPGMSLWGLLQQFQQGKVAQFSLRFIEGSSYQQWTTVLNTAPYLQNTLLDHSAEEVAKLLGLQAHIEGWLFPDTYYYTAGTSDLALLQRAHQRMQQQLAEVWQTRHPQLPLKTPYDLLILASIIEKESAVATERPTIASVFVNRLRRGMRLQACPTVIYGLSEPSYVGVLTHEMTRQPHRYNTYRILGLPPTPIAMPSRAALEAAARPAETSYLYFVANQAGGHTFTQDFAAHRHAARDYQKSKPIVLP